MANNTRTSINEIDETISTLAQTLPTLLEKLGTEFEIITGRKAKTPPSRIDLDKIARKFRKLASIAKQFEKLSSEALTPKSAQKILELFNRMFRLSVTGIPRNTEPIKYVIQVVKRQAEIPSGLVLPQGLDYKTKHLGLQDFLFELVSSVDSSHLDTFLQGTFTERQLASQFQRAFNNLSLPKELRSAPLKISLRTAERLKLALRDVTADWEALINLVYGLYLLKQGQRATWASIRRERLRNKVATLRQDSRLVHLTKPEWVTVRNSLDHGLAFFDPDKESLEFPTNTGRVSWNISAAYSEGVDIFLANLAMLKVFNFLNAAKIEKFERQIESIREIASQS